MGQKVHFFRQNNHFILLKKTGLCAPGEKSPDIMFREKKSVFWTMPGLLARYFLHGRGKNLQTFCPQSNLSGFHINI